MDYDGLILSIIQLFTQNFFFSIVTYICMMLCYSAENYMTINNNIIVY